MVQVDDGGVVMGGAVYGCRWDGGIVDEVGEGSGRRCLEVICERLHGRPRFIDSGLEWTVVASHARSSPISIRLLDHLTLLSSIPLSIKDVCSSRKHSLRAFRRAKRPALLGYKVTIKSTVVVRT